MGSIFKQLGRQNQAIEAYAKALSIDPNDAEAFNNKGVILYDQGKQYQAIEAFNKAVSINCNHTEALSNLGISLTGVTFQNQFQVCMKILSH